MKCAFVAAAIVLALAGVAHGAGAGSALRLAELVAPTLDPALASSPDARLVQAAICAPLYTLNAAGNPIPEVATGMPVAGPSRQRPKQWTTYTIHLRRTYAFSDGSPVNAYSYVEAAMRDADPDMGSPAAALMKQIVGVAAVAASEASEISGFVAANDTTLEITTMRRMPALAKLLAEPYFCPVLEETPVAAGGISNPPASGPYYLAGSTPTVLTFDRNPHFPGRKGTFKTITLASAMQFTSCQGDVRKGTVDICLDGLPQHAKSIDVSSLVAQGWLSASVGCLEWNATTRFALAALCRR